MDQTLSLLRNVIFEILQDMFFIFPEEYDDKEIKTVSDIELASFSIDIQGKDPFELYFFFTRDTGLEMASNYLGEEEETIDQKMIKETIKEAVNVIGGNFLNHMSMDLELGLPKYCKNFSFHEIYTSLNLKHALIYKVNEQPFISMIKY